ncbi:MAG: single-stranded-DNA-specific exonuclease RecJ [Gammaproteobacteria bacterium]|nr:single-stranded-DNA-specific exonuclease RecJ [Gammaproteobacteria bacterium]MDH4252916.1 single-stranded-DNA-specific exonuclease RecJ [Gammaproteobacteria bacterium]MDH5308398.1 single-stranded-DNA-specific exonuclease RecJ [Gammaproteobacteria bacterium]
MTGRQRPFRRRKPADIAGLAGLDPVLAGLYSARGVRFGEELDYSLAKLAPIGSLEGVEVAVRLLLLHRNRRIVVVGDFDADGATSTALVLRCLSGFGFGDVGYLVPNRFEYGYGLTPEIVDVAAQRRPDLLVTVDNGVSSVAGVERARELGIKVLVTDHHLPGRDLPRAAAMVNPNLPGSRFASPNLAGVGVAFYLMAALGRALEDSGVAGAARLPARFLDLVALGTVADVVRLDHNNRILVSQGLARLRAGQAVPGVLALMAQAGRSAARATSSDLGFAAGPRLNAAGRLEDMSIGIECLLTDDPARAAQLAATLDQINRERREIESVMRDQAFSAMKSIRDSGLPNCVCIYDESWHQGVVGLIAARVREQYHRPVVAFARERAGELKGSVRSVPGVHARDLLEAVATRHPGLIARFGGHAMAAGLSLAESDFDAFAAAADKELLLRHPDADFSGAILTDGSLPADALTLRFAQTLREAGPWGAGFPEPVFEGDFRVVEQRTVGERHLKLRVLAGEGQAQIDAIAFNQQDPGIRGRARLAYRLDVNEYRGVEAPQLVVEQITPL